MTQNRKYPVGQASTLQQYLLSYADFLVFYVFVSAIFSNSGRLITRRSWVQIPPPQPIGRHDGFPSCLSFFVSGPRGRKPSDIKASGHPKLFCSKYARFCLKSLSDNSPSADHAQFFTKASLSNGSKLFPFATVCYGLLKPLQNVVCGILLKKDYPAAYSGSRISADLPRFLAPLSWTADSKSLISR